MTESKQYRGFAGAIKDKFNVFIDVVTGRNETREKFVHLSELHKQLYAKENVSKYVADLRTRFGIMYELARLIHYPRK